MGISSNNRTYHIAQNSMELLPAYYKWVYSKFIKHIQGATVELGCGAGLGIGTYLNQASCVYAVDHNEELLKRIKDTYGSCKVIPLKADLIAEWDFLPEGQADTVIMLDVVEHFRNDIQLIKKAASLLSPNGKLLIKVPAQPSLYSSIDEASGHYRRYDKKSLEKLAFHAGLNIETIDNNNVVGALAYRFKSKNQVNFSRTFSRRQLKIINFTIPVIQLFDVLPFAGLSLMCVMSR